MNKEIAESQKPLLRVGVLGSGRGSNLGAVLHAIEQGRCRAEVRVVIADVEDAGIRQIARDHGVPEKYVVPGAFRTKMEPEIEQKMVDILREADVEVVMLAGYMRVVKETLLQAFDGCVINIHPSILPKFPGREAWKQALEAGETISGCTVHVVDSGVDTGPILAQRQVDILKGDTPETLHQRIQDAEHSLYPWVLNQIADGAMPIPLRNHRDDVG